MGADITDVVQPRWRRAGGGRCGARVDQVSRPAPSTAATGRTRGRQARPAGYSVMTASRSASTASGRTRLTVQPPNPAPVIRAATTPGTDDRDLDHRVELRGADLEPVPERRVALREQPSDGGEVAGGQGGDRGLDPGVLGHHVLGAPERDRVQAIAGRHEEPRASRRAGFGSSGRSRASSATAASHWLRRRLYAEPSRCRGEPVWQTTRTRSAGRGIGRHACDRQSSSSAAPATPHDSANWSMRPLWTPTIAVLGALADLGERERVDRRGGRVEHRPGRRELDRGRRRQPGVRRQGRRDHPAQTGQRQARLAQAPRPCRRRSPATGRAAVAASSRSNAVALAVVEAGQLDPPIRRSGRRRSGSRGRSRRAGRSPRCSRCARR